MVAMTNSQRRKALKTLAALAGSVALPQSLLAAIDNSASSGTPRVGLVIGNSRYGASPLRNPVNDAKAIAESLSSLGFSIDVLLDAGLKEMAAAIKTYGTRVANEKAVGLFYYAGHGAQLAWRNFLIPVDAAIEHLEDLPKQCVELNSLLGALNKAANPMNIIILDACRDNPFGKRVLTEQKGLSQFDAPPSSLLAYATAPGNTASDGQGANGLFTENLLREMRVPEAKLEDVFKRVRLNVRLQSSGQQVPWESTSLEDDFYFVPQGKARKESEDEQKRRFDEEQSVWGKAENASSVLPLEEYLRKYPNGNFSQLAQARLDKLLAAQGEKKAQIVSSGNNPFSKGAASGGGNYTLGDKFSFVVKDIYTELVEREFNAVVTEVTEISTVFNKGARIIDLLGNDIKSPNPRFLSSAQFFPAEYFVGQKWQTRFGWSKNDGTASEVEAEFKVVGREKLKTAFGEFYAFVVEGVGYVMGGDQFIYDYKIDPAACSQPLIFDVRSKISRINKVVFSKRTELVGFSQLKKRT
jgi:hypothetical protein